MHKVISTIACFLILGVPTDVDSQRASALASHTDAISVDAVVANLKGLEEKLESISVRGNAVVQYNFREPGVEPEEPELIEDSAVASKHIADVAWSLRSDGSARYESLIDVTNIRFDQSTVSKRRLFLSVFDGPRGQGRSVMTNVLPDGSWTGEERPGSTFNRGHDNPLKFVTEFLPDRTFSQAIVEDDAQVVGTQSWRGQSHLVLESRKPIDHASKRQVYFQLWFDTVRNCVARKLIYVRPDAKLPWHLAYQHHCLDYQFKDGNEIWLPTEVHSWNWVVAKDRKRYTSSEKHYTYTDWEINKPIGDELFSIRIPLKVMRLPVRGRLLTIEQ